MSFFERHGNKLYYDLDDEHIEIPSHYEVCGRCNGTGTHTNPNIDGNGLTQEDFDQDPDFHEDYMSGVYDIQCLDCKGERVELVPNEEQTPEIQEILEREREYRAEEAFERRMRMMGVEW